MDGSYKLVENALESVLRDHIGLVRSDRHAWMRHILLRLFSKSSGCKMASLQLCIVILVWYCIAFTCQANPLPFSQTNKPTNDMRKIPVTELYKVLPIEEVPTTIASDVRLSNKTRTRYGYSFGRPVSRVERLLKTRFGSVLKPIFGKVMTDFPEILHWGLLVSTSPPWNKKERIAKLGKWVPSPEDGIVFELRNSGNNNLVYLDIKNWTSYENAPPKVKYHGSVNKTDMELMSMGEAYIKQVGIKGFSNYYRNCQVFTSWFVQALWPKVPTAKRFDQLFGKALWWFKDWKKTARWGSSKLKGLLGFRVDKVEEVDSEASFVPVEEILNGGSSGSDTDRSTYEKYLDRYAAQLNEDRKF